jgi:hypothetical protein
MSFALRRLATAFALGALPTLPSTSTLPAQAASAPSAPSAVTLVDAGAAPRRALRYALTKGSTESMSLRQQIGMAMTVEGTAMPAPSMPATVMTTRIDVDDVAADGTADVRVEIVSLGVEAGDTDPALVAQMNPALAIMKGVTMRYRLSPTGQVSNLTMSENAPPQLQAAQALGSTEQFSVALPSEPVGVGAYWKTSRPVEQNGMTIDQEVEYRVRSLAGDTVVLEMALAQSATDQPVVTPTLPPGTNARLRSLSGAGKSTVVILLTRVQPSLELNMEMKLNLELDMAGQSMVMDQVMTMDVKSTSTPPA